MNDDPALQLRVARGAGVRLRELGATPPTVDLIGYTYEDLAGRLGRVVLDGQARASLG